ncbi:MAG: Crp/Fnr family transcriptional regulator [Ferruginibacter sp.]|nr:Crp/Fnr family transcriptional regulator [Cytophagales bacterium]
MYPSLQASIRRFVSLEEAEWALIAAAFHPKEVSAKEFLLRKGQVCRHIAFVESGLLRYYYLVGGKEMVGNFFFENSFVGDFGSFITGQPAVQFIDTLEDCRLLLASHSDWQQLYGRIPALERFGRLLAEGLFVHAQQRTASFLLDSPQQRYLNLLKNRPKVLQRVPQYMIASYLGITPEALSRIRRRLALEK